MNLSISTKSLAFIFLEYSVIAVCLITAYLYPLWWVWAIAFVIISTRQHALWMIFHDAVHFHLSPQKRLNDNLAYLFLSVSLFLPLHTFRDIHLVHHRFAGTSKDPERHILYRFQFWNYRALPFVKLLIQLGGDLLAVNNIVSLALPYQAEKKGHIKLAHLRPYPEYYVYLISFLVLMSSTLIFNQYLSLLIGVLWLLPLLTLSHLLHKLRSFAEHSDDEQAPTYSWKVGLIGRLTVWPYNINYHKEHHENPSVPWYELPVKFDSVEQKNDREFLSLLWNGELK
jgi:fatty acid desaturase